MNLDTTLTETQEKKTKCNINLFDEPPTKNRRMTPQEYHDELILAGIFKRPPNQYIKDLPFYPMYLLRLINNESKL